MHFSAFLPHLPVLNALKNMNAFVPNKWHPNLINYIVEEMDYNIDRTTQTPSLKPRFITSGKRCRAMSKKSIDTIHCNIISTAIENNDIYRVQILSAQNDGGANRSVTSTKSLLLHYEHIDDYAMNGVKEGKPAIICTGRGYLPWRANSGEIILI